MRRHTSSDPVAAPPTVAMPAAERRTIQAGHQQARRLDSPMACTYTPCGRCLNCPCRQPKNYSEAQREYPPLRPSRSTSSRRTPSLGPPQLWPEGPTDHTQGETMSQGSGESPVNFLDPATCDAILEGLRDQERYIPDFTVSPPGTPP